MDIGILDLFWIFLVFSSLAPMLQKKLLEIARQRMMRQFEQKRGSRLITLIHRQETLSFLGIGFSRYIDIEDSEEVLRAIRLTPPNMPLDLVLHTPGGLVLAAEQIAHALIRHEGPVTVFVPHYAMSGGTLIALAADKIVMDENAVLGPVDPQVGQFAAASILSVLEVKNVNEIDDETLMLADIARKARTQVHDTVRMILMGNGMDAEKARQIAELMSCGKWTHDYPISFEEAQEIGLPVETPLPPEVFSLMSLYPQTAQRRPSVGYIPMPYAPRKPEKVE